MARWMNIFFCEKGMIRVPHPAFSPDLALFDCYFFGKLKNIMKRSEFRNENELFLWIISKVSQLGRKALEAVFNE
jgi:hypothetical protein